jgi:hypothetical protein
VVRTESKVSRESARRHGAGALLRSRRAAVNKPECTARQARSPEFTQWRPSHDVPPRLSGRKLMALPGGVRAAFEHPSYAINGLIDCPLALYVPVEEPA